MMPFNFALEANNLGRILDFLLDLLLLEEFGLLIVGYKSKSTLVIGDFCALNILSSLDFPS
jgi:hypothetical protein